MLFLILVAELLALFFLSRTVTGNLFQLIYRLTRSRSVAISVVSLLLYPGTVIHELAHLFTAEILGVHTGKLTLVPEGLTDEHEVRSGSVMIAQTDPFRRAMIGLAPFAAGLLFCGVLSYFYSLPLSWYLQYFHFAISNLQFAILRSVQLYLLFSVSSSMFPSSTDMKGVWALGIVILLLVAVGFAAGVNIALTGTIVDILTSLLTNAFHTFFLVLLIQAALWIITKVFFTFTK